MALISFIPKRFEEGFKRLSSISDADFKQIEEGLSLTSLVSSIRVLADKVIKAKGLEELGVEDIFLSVGSLIPFLNKAEALKQIVDDITLISIDKEFTNQDGKELFVRRLSFLLSNQQIFYASKGSELMSEKENIFIHSRIVTDIRPVFGIDFETTPKAGIITHNLHIHYRAHEEGAHKDIYLALDSRDIKLLKEALERAEKKELSLKPIFDKTGMQNLNE